MQMGFARHRQGVTAAERLVASAVSAERATLFMPVVLVVLADRHHLTMETAAVVVLAVLMLQVQPVVRAALVQARMLVALVVVQMAA